MWTSTSPKNPKYSDVKYNESLIGPYSIITIPIQTLEAYLDQGTSSNLFEVDVEPASWVLSDLSEMGDDNRIGLARLDLPDVLPPAGVAFLLKNNVWPA